MITATGPLNDLATELKRQMTTRRDLLADTRLVSLSEIDGGDRDKPNPVELLIDLPDGMEGFSVNDHAHGQIATHLDVPRKLYDRLLGNHPDLLCGLTNGLLAREPAKRRVRILDDKVRAFLSDRYRPRDNWDLMDLAVLPVLRDFAGSVEVKRCDLTETKMYVKIVLPDFEMPVTPKVGDVIRGGVIIQNSEVGSGSLGIYPYTDRLICTNGMVHTDMGKRQRHVGKRIETTDTTEAWELYSDETIRLDDEAFFAKCQDVLKAVLNETVFEQIVGQMQELAGIRVQGAPDKVVELFASTHRLRETERDSMLEALIEDADLSGWGYVNALTRTARDLTDFDRQTELETLAGELVSDHGWALVAA